MTIPIEHLSSPRFDDLESTDDPLVSLVGDLLEHLGEDTDREGLLRTPTRVSSTLRFLTHGYDMTVDEVVNDAIYHEESRDMVVVKDIAFYSLCEHHLLPFFGRVHVAYIPAGRVIGLSKVARLVEMFSRRLQMQERITTQVADALEQVLEPEGVAVVMEGAHLCMMMRGVEEQHSSTITASLRGRFESDPVVRDDFFRFVPVDGSSL